RWRRSNARTGVSRSTAEFYRPRATAAAARSPSQRATTPARAPPPTGAAGRLVPNVRPAGSANFHIEARRPGHSTGVTTTAPRSRHRRPPPFGALPPGLSGEELIARHRRHPDPRLRDRVIEQYMPLARRLAVRYHR